MDLEADKLRHSSLHWTKVSAMLCFLFAGAVLVFSLIPVAPATQHTTDPITANRH